MYPHRIRLRGPWEYQPLLRRGDNADQALPLPGRMTMPCHWSAGGLSDFTGRVRFRRSFGYPGRIDAHERVWLTFAGIGGQGETWLNDHWLGEIAAPCEFEVTALLRPRNELVAEIEGTAEEGGLWGEVALEVRCTAFLRSLTQTAILIGDSIHLRVCGQVVGVAERPLDLYLLVDGATAGYQLVTSAAEGQPFEFNVPHLPAVNRQTLPVQVDLVNGAVVWYTHSGEVRVETGPDQAE